MNINKKVSALGICLAVLFCINKTSFASTGTVNTELVRVRESASTESNIVLNLKQDATVEVLEESGDWYKIKTGETTGYIHKNYLTVAEEPESESTEQAGQPNDTDTEEVLEEESIEEQVIGNKLNQETSIYLLPALNSSKISTIQKDTEVKIVKTINNWSNVEIGNEKGWIPNQKLLTSNKETLEQEDTSEEEEEISSEESSKKEVNQKGYVNTESANLRDGPSTTNNAIAGLIKNEVLLVISEENDWYEVRLTDGTNGYVSKSLVTLGEAPITTSRSAEMRQQAKTTESTTASTVGNSDIVSVASQYLGYKYVSGGSSPSTGFDCSGFTSYVYAQCGLSISRTSYAQANNGVIVDKSNLQPGDLLLFHYYGSSSIDHVGIYIGNGQFIHAANTTRGVVIDSITSGYYAENYAGARRIN